jgi:uncharacterized protein with PQ loop repeat
VTVDFFSQLSAVLAAGICAMFGFVQLHRTLRTRSVSGVSGFSWLATATNAGVWFVYGARTGSPQQLLANGPWVLTAVVLGVFFARTRGVPPVVGVVGGLLGLPIGLLVNAFGAGGVSVVGVVLLFGVTVPQIAVLRRTTDTTGVSLGGWVLAVVASVCWLMHGLLESEPAVYLCSALGCTLNMITVITLVRARRRAHSGRGEVPVALTGQRYPAAAR